MATFYLVNCTQQNQEFSYRLGGANFQGLKGNLRVQHVPIGGQVALSGDLSTSDIESILTQHRQYGLISVEEIDRTKPFIGLCYSIDKRVNVDAIKRAIVHNEEVLVERGQQTRQEASVALNAALEQNTGPLRSLELSFSEHRDNPNNLEGAMAEGYRVTREAPEETQKRRRSGRAR